MRHTAPNRYSYGIGEWFGRLFTAIDREQAAELAKTKKPPCPFRPEKTCGKRGGVCSLLRYELQEDVVLPVGSLVATCPSRFFENNDVFKWVAQVAIDTSQPILLKEIKFLKSVGQEGGGESAEQEDVGRIDNVLVHPDLDLLRWCALEMQAVYFSGDDMPREFLHAASHSGAWPPFPAGRRRPDFRSSGPKRLMPQLQIKVPTLRRWGKKMAVVVDSAFFAALAPMTAVSDISNADIVWFVVKYELHEDRATLTRGMTVATTLENAVDGLTAGQPVSLSQFEQQLLHKARKLTPLD